MEDSLIRSGIERSNKVKNHILISFFLKGLSVLLSFWLVPLTLSFLGKELYGVWIVMLSIMTWLALFDIGVGNGLRNKLAESLAHKDIIEAKKNISTAYTLISLIGIVLLMLSLIIIPFLNWNHVLNIKILSNEKLVGTMLIFFSTLIISFVLSLINPILSAFQLSSFTNLGNIITSFVFISLLMVFRKFVLNNLFLITSLYCISLIFSNLCISAIFFSRNRHVFPSLKYLDRSQSKSILNLGGAFFIIQIAVLLIFTVDNFLILQLLGGDSVSIYNIVFKLFSIFTVGYTIIMTPLWSAFTEAYVKKDFKWIRKTISWLNLSIIPLIIGLTIFILFYQKILDIWLPSSERITPSFKFVISLAIFVIITIWNSIYANFLNGISATKLQTKTAIFGALINVPLALLFVKVFKMELPGVVLAMCISLLPFSLLGPIESYKHLPSHLK
ncbi:oligosaccharide flippase family protein [Agrobacterium tumefaciens]|nr:oligosaccharide flippase family protein [Agrobacterium tumefaciens]NTE21958.1 oligosaccharide flippase family protein [Agrobacterium tumefaciens]